MKNTLKNTKLQKIQLQMHRGGPAPVEAQARMRLNSASVEVQVQMRTKRHHRWCRKSRFPFEETGLKERPSHSPYGTGRQSPLRASQRLRV